MTARFNSLSFCILAAMTAWCNVVKVGSASYSDSFPGVDKAGRNSYPAVAPYVSGKAATRPISTNEWWSNELVNPHAAGIFSYPLALRPVDAGLVMINNMTGQAVTVETPLTIGVEGLSSPQTTVSDYSDWSVTINWTSSSGQMEATAALGCPFVYFTKSSDSPVRIDVGSGNVSIDGNTVYIDGSYNRASYVIFAPAGSTWNRIGNTLTSTLAGKDYWSAAMLPAGSDARTAGSLLAPAAFVFPADTKAEWRYNPQTGSVETVYQVTPDVKEGKYDKVAMGLLPHHWSNIKTDTPDYIDQLNFQTVRGELRIALTNSFTTSLQFHGILPYLPLSENISEFSKDELRRLVDAVCNDSGFSDWTDSYNDGQLLNRLVQTAEAAYSAGDNEGFEKAYSLVKSQLERWLTYSQGDIDFMFYYHRPWNTMIGYPAGHGQDTNINDHNFHWGYFIRAAAMIARHDRKWADDWGEMINLLVRDVASSDRNDDMFPYLRSFSPYAGHCWANGTASLGLGNDQESTSEAMQFNTALILWGDVTGNRKIRDLGVWLYATELSAIEEYWFDVAGRNLDPGLGAALASRVFGNGYDKENFWGGGIAGSYGIQIYPVHAGSFYLVNHPDYADKLWNAMASETGILANDDNPNIWYDTWIRFVAMIDCDKAMKMYEGCRHLGKKFGESQAHTYQWINAVSELGQPAEGISADYPVAMAFDNNGLMTYIADNTSDSTIRVRFSDGYILDAAPNIMSVASSGTLNPGLTLSVSSDNITIGDEVTVTVLTDLPDDSGIDINAVSIILNSETAATFLQAPYVFNWTPLEEGSYRLQGVMTTSEGTEVRSNVVTINVRPEGQPSTPVMTFTGTEASEGEFHGTYTVTCETKNNSVEIIASFDGDYAGFAGPWFFNESEGFSETMMTEAGKGFYRKVIDGGCDGDVIRFRIKIAYAGNLGITRQFQYVVGSSDRPTGFKTTDKDIRLLYDRDRDLIVVSSFSRASVAVYDLTGSLVGMAETSGENIVISTLDYRPGVYFISVRTSSGILTKKIII